ncbi:N-6 DNA methylase [Lactobacillus taiwanensis]|uniref:Methylase n=1 Tax=Lactobacillus taiwanensis TaxID=508451 RepID=A0A256LAB7_9LACO|nr:N-6 DNA methylase [Lactobacillus taiwanensis]OYR87155.1 methylase [Lactobacillus taiwanensis]OYR90026.1 methylase [Lactobacillus taiwanensis]OYR92436.1 methylase [Lactobacillus taiwanensis]OYR95342.1 methylase [Lactobacillus taiwanensis]
MQFDVSTVNKILNIDDAYKAPDTLLALMLDKTQRENIFKKFLNISTDLSFDWFHEYFEDEQAERKSKKQDFTPDSIATLLNKLTSNTTGYYYEPTAGTGGILITRWWQDCLNDPVGTKNNTNIPGISFFTYDPRKYWYQVEELSDRAVPFLIFNMALRGMNGVAIQCDSLSREAKNVYFIRNNTDNALAFSEVIKLPKTSEYEKELNINWKI